MESTIQMKDLHDNEEIGNLTPVIKKEFPDANITETESPSPLDLRINNDSNKDKKHHFDYTDDASLKADDLIQEKISQPEDVERVIEDENSNANEHDVTHAENISDSPKPVTSSNCITRDSSENPEVNLVNVTRDISEISENNGGSSERPEGNQFARDFSEKQDDNEIIRDALEKVDDNEIERGASERSEDNEIIRDFSQKPEDNEIIRDTSEKSEVDSKGHVGVKAMKDEVTDIQSVNAKRENTFSDCDLESSGVVIELASGESGESDEEEITLNINEDGTIRNEEFMETGNNSDKEENQYEKTGYPYQEDVNQFYQQPMLFEDTFISAGISCFSCGKIYNTLLDLKTHIETTHMETSRNLDSEIVDEENQDLDEVYEPGEVKHTKKSKSTLKKPERRKPRKRATPRKCLQPTSLKPKECVVKQEKKNLEQPLRKSVAKNKTDQRPVKTKSRKNNVKVGLSLKKGEKQVFKKHKELKIKLEKTVIKENKPRKKSKDSIVERFKADDENNFNEEKYDEDFTNSDVNEVQSGRDDPDYVMEGEEAEKPEVDEKVGKKKAKGKRKRLNNNIKMSNSKDKSWSCELCDKEFKKRADLVIHRDVHKVIHIIKYFKNSLYDCIVLWNVSGKLHMEVDVPKNLQRKRFYPFPSNCYKAKISQ